MGILCQRSIEEEQQRVPNVAHPKLRSVKCKAPHKLVEGCFILELAKIQASAEQLEDTESLIADEPHLQMILQHASTFHNLQTDHYDLMSLIEYHLDESPSLLSTFRSSKQGSVATSNGSTCMSRGHNTDTFKFNVDASDSDDVTLFLASLENFEVRKFADVKLNLQELSKKRGG